MGPEIHLLLPDLLAKGLGQSGIAVPSAPALERLLARAERGPHPYDDPDQYACRLMGIEGEELPLGALCRLAETGRHDGRDWFRAEPVHLLADRDRLLLDAQRPELSQNEAGTLIAELNDHFRGDGLALEMGSPGRWYLSVSEQPELRTRPPEAADRGDIRPCMPTGRDELKWHSWLNEMQMLLHNSPVNAEREARGAKPVNGLWIWGGGTLPESADMGEFVLWAAEGACASRGAAGLAGAEVFPVPDSVEPVRASSAPRKIVVATEFQDHLRRRDLEGWCRALDKWERNWFGPLLRELKWGRISRLELWGGGDARYVLRPSLAWRLWRRPQSLARLDSSAGPFNAE